MHPVVLSLRLSHTCLSPQDLEGKIIVDELKQEVITTNSKAEPPQCTSLAWSADGQVRSPPGANVSLRVMRLFVCWIVNVGVIGGRRVLVQ